MTARLNMTLLRIGVMTLALAAGGCSIATLDMQVQSQVPEPVVKPIPIDLGVYYSDEFQNFIYTERTDDRKDWRIDNKTARLALFEGVLSSMFDTTERVDGQAIANEDLSVDAILEPNVLDMQLALPQETGMKLYEAWVKYDMKLYRPGGTLIDQWQLTGYGKASSENVGGPEAGLNAAINLALRDVGAKMTLGFTKNQGVVNWLCEKQKCAEIIQN